MRKRVLGQQGNRERQQDSELVVCYKVFTSSFRVNRISHSLKKAVVKGEAPSKVELTPIKHNTDLGAAVGVSRSANRDEGLEAHRRARVKVRQSTVLTQEVTQGRYGAPRS
eukprot:Selendium_serpulae@DN4275_c0_g1_i4.p1